MRNHHESLLAVEFDDADRARHALAAALARGFTDASVVDRTTRLRTPGSFLDEAETPLAVAGRLAVALLTAASLGVTLTVVATALGVAPPGLPPTLVVVLGGLVGACGAAAGWTLWFTLALLHPSDALLHRSYRVLVFGDTRRLIDLRDGPAFSARRASRR